MSEFSVENNVHVCGGAWVAVEHFFLFVRTTKWGEFSLSVFGLGLLVEVFGCIRTL